MYSKLLILQVKELMDRYHNNAAEIATKLHMDPVTVQLIIDQITDMLT